MSEKPELPRPAPPALLASVVDQLACPVCFAAVEISERRLVCTSCKRVYPIVDGIPVLIAEHLSTSNPE